MKIAYIQPYITYSSQIEDTLPGCLARKGHQVFVLAHTTGKFSAVPVELARNLKLWSARSLSFSIGTSIPKFPIFLGLDSMIDEIRPDVIHANNLPFFTTVQSAKISKKRGIPSVTQIHGVTASKGIAVNMAQRAFIFCMSRSLFYSTQRVLCLTHQDAKNVQKFGCPPEKIQILPNGVDTHRFHPSLDEPSFDILWAGRFVVEKGLNYLLMAIRKAINTFPKLRVALVGDGPLFSSITSQVAELGLTSNVSLLGRRSHSQMPSILNEGKIHVLPSLREGMPYSLLESMACEKPVIGSDISGINDIIRNRFNGILTPATDAESLAAAIVELLRNSTLRKQIALNARQTVVEKYDWQDITCRAESIYHKLF